MQEKTLAELIARKAAATEATIPAPTPPPADQPAGASVQSEYAMRKLTFFPIEEREIWNLSALSIASSASFSIAGFLLSEWLQLSSEPQPLPPSPPGVPTWPWLAGAIVFALVGLLAFAGRWSIVHHIKKTSKVQVIEIPGKTS